MQRRNKILALIPARAGSKRLPDKNIKPFCGKPLIAWTIEEAKKNKSIERVIVSTDDERIAIVSRKCGAQVPFLRLKELAGDNTPTIDVALNLLEYLQFKEGYVPDLLVLLQPTSPLRVSQDIDKALEILFFNRSADAVVSIVAISKNHYWTKKLNNKGFISNLMPESMTSRPTEIYMPNGALYICKTRILLQEKTFFPKRTLGYVMSRDKSVDIDDTLDFQLAELLAKRQRDLKLI